MIQKLTNYSVIYTASDLRAESGVSRAIIDSANSCALAGSRSVIILSSSYDRNNVSMIPDGVVAEFADNDMGAIESLWVYWQRIRASIRLFLSTGGSVLVHDNGLWMPSNIISALIAKAEGVPYIISTHGMLLPAALQIRRTKKWLAWRAYQRYIIKAATAIHVTSEQEREYLEKYFPTANIVLIPLGIHNTSPLLSIRPKRALFLSRIHPIKGVDLLIKAWSSVDTTEWQLVIAGPPEGEYVDVLRGMISELGLRERVLIRSGAYGLEKQALLADSALFILPSRSENFGLAIGEALEAGLPVITTTTTPWPDLVSWGAGWVVEPTTNGLASAIAEATSTSQEGLALMGMRGRDFVLSRYSIARFHQKMQEMYHTVLLAAGQSR